ncbi:flagellar biosynthesis protein FliQ [Silvanigrella paludirubra]|uniref:Flagellar biosynthetic protein FliQ n=1 Tax=Silvanigrella paludirubra TaxID=2499159 RepID=A0A6N6VU27_9BACT|nr:flagellar biosynthesis protein FliQ [Silvanigrella paludirubra]KAB8036222.1 flagellar biosynthesis protein FliQ [Silvanigrella paludirubra]
MTNQQVVDVILSVLYITVEVSLPLLGVAMIIGLLVSIFQAATQINESTLSFLPKIAAMILVLIVLSPWMLRKLNDYTHRVYDKIPEYARQK